MGRAELDCSVAPQSPKQRVLGVVLGGPEEWGLHRQCWQKSPSRPGRNVVL